MYVASGFFFYSVALLAFINEGPAGAKLAIMGVFTLFALGFLFGGLRASSSANRKRDVGVVVLCGALAAAFVVLTFVCMIATPEFRQIFPDNKLAFFSDYMGGGVTIASFAILGSILIWHSRGSKAA